MIYSNLNGNLEAYPYAQEEINATSSRYRASTLSPSPLLAAITFRICGSFTIIWRVMAGLIMAAHTAYIGCTLLSVSNFKGGQADMAQNYHTMEHGPQSCHMIN